jgi:hypothetical protein
VYDAYGGHTLAFRFLRKETVGRSPPKFEFREEVKPDTGKAAEVAAPTKVPTTNAKPWSRLVPKSRVVQVEDKDEDRTGPYVAPADEETRPNPFAGLLLSPVKRKADTEADGDGGTAMKK